jgi:hypothetical protein
MFAAQAADGTLLDAVGHGAGVHSFRAGPAVERLASGWSGMNTVVCSGLLLVWLTGRPAWLPRPNLWLGG